MLQLDIMDNPIMLTGFIDTYLCMFDDLMEERNSNVFSLLVYPKRSITIFRQQIALVGGMSVQGAGRGHGVRTNIPSIPLHPLTKHHQSIFMLLSCTLALPPPSIGLDLNFFNGDILCHKGELHLHFSEI